MIILPSKRRHCECLIIRRFGFADGVERKPTTPECGGLFAPLFAMRDYSKIPRSEGTCRASPPPSNSLSTTEVPVGSWRMNTSETPIAGPCETRTLG